MQLQATNLFETGQTDTFALQVHTACRHVATRVYTRGYMYGHNSFPCTSLYICQSTHMSVHLTMHLSVHVPIHISIHIFIT